MAHGVFVPVAERLAAKFHPHDWSAIFCTSDVVVESNFLTALGCYAACDRGLAVEDLVGALRAVMSGIVAGLQPAIGLFPHLIGELRDSGSAEREMLRDPVEQVFVECKALGAVLQDNGGQLSR